MHDSTLWLSTRHVARILDCDIGQVRRWCEKKKITGKKIFGRWKVYRPALEALLNGNEPEPPKELATPAPNPGHLDAELAALGIL